MMGDDGVMVVVVGRRAACTHLSILGVIILFRVLQLLVALRHARQEIALLLLLRRG
jgi:hypothetical protein